MSWLRALKETARSGLSVERKRLEPLIALRATAGLALVIAVTLWAFGPAVAASSAFGAFQAAIATFQRSWRPRPELALASGASLAVSTFVGYLTVSHLILFLALLALWTFVSGLSWAVGPTAGIIVSSNVAMMLVTVTLPTSVGQAAGHAAMMIVGGLVQAALVVLFPVRRWGAHRDALADALAAEADYARRLRHDPVAPFDPAPLMEARDAATVTARQARSRPAELHGARGVAERIRPVLASLADPAVGVPEEGPERTRVHELLAAAGTILDAAARAIRHGEPIRLPSAAIATFRTPDTGSILTGPAYRAAARLGALLTDVLETADPSAHGATGLGGRGAVTADATVITAATPTGRATDGEPGAGAGHATGTGIDASAGHAADTDADASAAPDVGAGLGASAVPDAGTAVAASGRDRSARGPGGLTALPAAGGRLAADAAVDASPLRQGTEITPDAPGRWPTGLLLRVRLLGRAGPRAAARLTAPGDPGPEGGGPGLRLRPSLWHLAPVAARSIRKELHHDSPVLRHAYRVTAVATTGYLLGTLLPLGHAYWAPLASVMIMRPDFSQTYSRAVARFAGTLVGVTVATGIVRLASPTTDLSAVLAVLSAGTMYLLMRTGQIAAQAAIAAYVVFLLGMAGEQWTQTVPERVLLTLIGGLLAMLSYAVYPAWETPRLRTRLADSLIAVGRYAATVVEHYAEPVGKDAPDVREALLAGRTARAAWHAAVARARDEPVRHRGLSRAAAEDAGDALGQVGRAAMLLEAHLPERGAPPVPGAARLAAALRAATEQGAKAVRERRVPRWDPLRDVVDDWDRLPPGAPDGVVGKGARMLLDALDALSDALDVTSEPMTVDGTESRVRHA
ncbi:FUSC family protein [Streptomyces sp. NPDC002004]